MKKLTALIMAFVLCFTLAACNKKTDKEADVLETKPPKQELEQEAEHTSLLTITTEDKKAIELGSAKDEVIKTMGEPVKERAYALEYDGATVYLNETVNMITINGEGYTGYKKASVGMEIDEYQKALDKDEYSVEKQEDIGFYRITISADEKGDIVKSDGNAAYLFTVTSNNYGEESTITHIQLKHTGI